MRLAPPPITAGEAELRAWLHRFSTDRAPLGLATGSQDDPPSRLQVSAKRIRRLWREEGLRVPQRRKKKPLMGIGVAVGAMSPIRANVIWAMDFQLDTIADGRTLKMLYVSRRSPVKHSRSRLSAPSTPTVSSMCSIAWLTRTAHRTTCASTTVRSRAHALHDWCRLNSAGLLFIDPGSPWLNAWIESFNGRLR
jgi:putative transposase